MTNDLIQPTKELAELQRWLAERQAGKNLWQEIPAQVAQIYLTAIAEKQKQLAKITDPMERLDAESQLYGLCERGMATWERVAEFVYPKPQPHYAPPTNERVIIVFEEADKTI